MKSILIICTLLLSLNGNPLPSIPNMKQLRSGQTDYRFTETNGVKIWTQAKTGKRLLEENNRVRPFERKNAREVTSEPGVPEPASEPTASPEPVPAPASVAATTDSPFTFPADTPVCGQNGFPGGIGPFPSTNERRKDFISGSQSVLGNDRFGMALTLAAASLETSFGSNMPQSSDSKHNTDRQEIGPMRMNRLMLDLLGYSRDQQALMGSLSSEGNVLAAEAFAKGLQTYGLEGMMHFHRGGVTRFEQRAQLDEGTRKDTFVFMQAYQAIQRTILENGLLDADSDLMAWTQGPVAI